MIETNLKKGSQHKRHKHPYEQTDGYLVSGRIRLFIGAETHEGRTGGDSWCVLENVEHGTEFLEDSVVVELFSPVRAEYL